MYRLFLVLTCSSLMAYDQTAQYALPHLTVQQAESIALDDNYNIQSFLYLADQGYYNKWAAAGQWLPQVSLHAETRRMPLGPAPLGYATFNSSTISFFQNVFNTDAYFAVQAADLNFKLDLANLLQETVDVLFDVRVGYFSIIFAQLSLEVQKDNVRLLEELNERERARFEAGEGNLYLVDQSEVSVQNALTLLYQAEDQLNTAIYDFLAFLGLPPTTQFTLAEHDIDLEKIPFIYERVKKMAERPLPHEALFPMGEIRRWEEMAYDYNPDIEIQRINYFLDIVNRNQKIGRYTPTVNLFADYFNFGGGNFLPPKSYWDMGVNLNWTLFDGFTRENSVKSSIKQVGSGENLFFEAVLQSQDVLFDRLADLEAALKTYRSSKRGVEVGTEAVDIALLEKDVGALSFLEYLQTIQALLVARQSFIQAKFNLVAAYFAILRVTGADVLNLEEGLNANCGFAYFGDFSLHYDTARMHYETIRHGLDSALYNF